MGHERPVLIRPKLLVRERSATLGQTLNSFGTRMRLRRRPPQREPYSGAAAGAPGGLDAAALEVASGTLPGAVAGHTNGMPVLVATHGRPSFGVVGASWRGSSLRGPATHYNSYYGGRLLVFGTATPFRDSAR
jgi:hypothetical protein